MLYYKCINYGFVGILKNNSLSNEFEILFALTIVTNPSEMKCYFKFKILNVNIIY